MMQGLSLPPSDLSPLPSPHEGESPTMGGAARRARPAAAKTFQCRGYGECRMVFSRSEHLARHVRKHTGERPFPCHCGKSFSRLDNLRQHAQTVHAEKAADNEQMIRELATLHANMSVAGKGGRAAQKRRTTCPSTRDPAPAPDTSPRPTPPCSTPQLQLADPPALLPGLTHTDSPSPSTSNSSHSSSFCTLPSPPVPPAGIPFGTIPDPSSAAASSPFGTAAQHPRAPTHPPLWRLSTVNLAAAAAAAGSSQPGTATGTPALRPFSPSPSGSPESALVPARPASVPDPASLGPAGLAAARFPRSQPSSPQPMGLLPTGTMPPTMPFRSTGYFPYPHPAGDPTRPGTGPAPLPPPTSMMGPSSADGLAWPLDPPTYHSAHMAHGPPPHAAETAWASGSGSDYPHPHHTEHHPDYPPSGMTETMAPTIPSLSLHRPSLPNVALSPTLPHPSGPAGAAGTHGSGRSRTATPTSTTDPDDRARAADTRTGRAPPAMSPGHPPAGSPSWSSAPTTAMDPAIQQLEELERYYHYHQQQHHQHHQQQHQQGMYGAALDLHPQPAHPPRALSPARASPSAHLRSPSGTTDPHQAMEAPGSSGYSQDLARHQQEQMRRAMDLPHHMQHPQHHQHQQHQQQQHHMMARYTPTPGMLSPAPYPPLPPSPAEQLAAHRPSPVQAQQQQGGPPPPTRTLSRALPSAPHAPRRAQAPRRLYPLDLADGATHLHSHPAHQGQQPQGFAQHSPATAHHPHHPAHHWMDQQQQQQHAGAMDMARMYGALPPTPMEMPYYAAPMQHHPHMEHHQQQHHQQQAYGMGFIPHPQQQQGPPSAHPHAPTPPPLLSLE